MNFTKFLLQEVTNHTNGEVSQRIMVATDTNQLIRLFHPNHTLEDIKKDADSIRKSLVVGESEYGKFAYIPLAITLEEF
jgi:hypothetical protein